MNGNMRRKRFGIAGKAAAFVTAMTVAVTCVFAGGSVAFAAEAAGDPALEETRAFIVNEDGTQTEISQEELEELRENSLPEFPETIDVVLEDSDPEWVMDGEDPLLIDEEPAWEDSAVQGEEAAAAAEEESISEAAEGNMAYDDPADGSDAEGLIEDESAGEPETPEEADDFGDVALWGDGNVTSIQIPGLIGKKGYLSPVYDKAIIRQGEVEGKKLNAGSASSLYGGVASGYYNININQSGSTVTVSGTINAPYSFYGLFVDLTLVAPVTGSSVNESINMNQFDTGYHTVSLAIIKGSDTTIMDLIGRKYMSSNKIVATPTYYGKFQVYSNYFTYYPYNMALENQQGPLYMEYSSDGGKTWQRTGYMQANMIKLYIEQAYNISGLKAKTKYLTRIRYGTSVTYSTDYAGDGKSYFFGGPPLSTTTIKTGAAKKPPIKSVRAQAVNVKYHQIRHYGRYTGVYLYTERFYTCKVKVTVKLKRKPGTKGMWINGSWLKGNKKTYVKTFAPYPNYYVKHPRGHYRFSVSVCSGQSGVWGGYSPTWSKSPKLS